MSQTPSQMVTCLAHSAHNIAKLRRCCERRQIKDQSLCKQRKKLEAMILPVFQEALSRHETHSWVELVHQKPDVSAELFASQPGLLSSLLLAMRIIESGYVDLRRTIPKKDFNLIGSIYRHYPRGVGQDEDPSDLDAVIVYRDNSDTECLISRISDSHPVVAEGTVQGEAFGFGGSTSYLGLYHA